MIDLTKEFNKIIDKDAEYMYIIVRHNTDTRCNCWRKESDTPDPECGNCEGGGWVFNEWLEKGRVSFMTTHRVGHTHDFNYGKTFTQNYLLYLKASERNRTIRDNDLLFLVKAETNGKLKNPIVRARKLQVIGAYDFQTEDGKTDFVKIDAKPLTV